jgi:hypothetical protein
MSSSDRCPRAATRRQGELVDRFFLARQVGREDGVRGGGRAAVASCGLERSFRLHQRHVLAVERIVWMEPEGSRREERVLNGIVLSLHIRKKTKFAPAPASRLTQPDTPQTPRQGTSSTSSRTSDEKYFQHSLQTVNVLRRQSPLASVGVRVRQLALLSTAARSLDVLLAQDPVHHGGRLVFPRRARCTRRRLGSEVLVF